MSNVLKRVAPLAVLTAAVSVAACGGNSPAPHRTPTLPSAPPTTTPAPSSLKPPLRGLLDRSGEPPAALLPAMGGWVVNVYWTNLQPEPGAPLPPNNPIDSAIAAVRQANAAHHVQLGLKLRIFAGIWAPAWAKSIGGPPVPLTNPQGGAAGTVGRFWTAAFGAAYDSFQAELAARYDSVPEVREVTVARCMTFYDEPLIRDIGDSASVSALLSAGFTAEADAACQEDELTSAARAWHHTRIDLAVNPYQEIEPGGAVATNETFTDDLMAYCRAVMGTQCVLENNSLRSTPQSPGYAEMYATMFRLGPPLSFQTASASRVGDLSATVEYALGLRADSVELPSGYSTALSPSSVSSLGRQLAAQAVA